MSLRIEQAVVQIKHDVSKAFDAAAIVALCQSIGYSWRTRQFYHVATIQGFLLQVLHGNAACSHVPRLLGKDVTAEAYGMDRSRLPLELFQRLLEQVCDRLHGCGTRGITLVTTLLDAKQYRVEDLAELYGKRWQIETIRRHLKQTLHIDVLRTQSVDGIH